MWHRRQYRTLQQQRKVHFCDVVFQSGTSEYRPFTWTTEVQRLQKSACRSVLKSKAITNSFENKPKKSLFTKERLKDSYTLANDMDSNSVSGALPTQILNTARHMPPSSTAHQRETLLQLCCHYDSVLWSFQRLTIRCGHITIGCGFPSSKGASLSKARTGIFSCLNLKRSSAKFVLPSSPRGGKCRGAGIEW